MRVLILAPTQVFVWVMGVGTFIVGACVFALSIGLVYPEDLRSGRVIPGALVFGIVFGGLVALFAGVIRSRPVMAYGVPMTQAERAAASLAVLDAKPPADPRIRAAALYFAQKQVDSRQGYTGLLAMMPIYLLISLRAILLAPALLVFPLIVIMIIATLSARAKRQARAYLEADAAVPQPSTNADGGRPV